MTSRSAELINKHLKKSKYIKTKKIKKSKNQKIQKLFLCCRVWAAVVLVGLKKLLLLLINIVETLFCNYQTTYRIP